MIKERRITMLACELAINWIDSLIDAHTTRYNMDTMEYEVPDGFKKVVTTWEKDRKDISELYDSLKK